jgi:hypothetical protein
LAAADRDRQSQLFSSLSPGPSYRLLQSSEGNSKPLQALGISWALSAYF